LQVMLYTSDPTSLPSLKCIEVPVGDSTEILEVPMATQRNRDSTEPKISSRKQQVGERLTLWHARPLPKPYTPSEAIFMAFGRVSVSLGHEVCDLNHERNFDATHSGSRTRNLKSLQKHMNLLASMSINQRFLAVSHD